MQLSPMNDSWKSSLGNLILRGARGPFGIPDLYPKVGGSLDKWIGKKRGAPSIPETHVRIGKIYRARVHTRWH